MKWINTDTDHQARLREALIEASDGDYVFYVQESGEREHNLPLAVPAAALSQFELWLIKQGYIEKG